MQSFQTSEVGLSYVSLKIGSYVLAVLTMLFIPCYSFEKLENQVMTQNINTFLWLSNFIFKVKLIFIRERRRRILCTTAIGQIRISS